MDKWIVWAAVIALAFVAFVSVAIKLSSRPAGTDLFRGLRNALREDRADDVIIILALGVVDADPEYWPPRVLELIHSIHRHDLALRLEESGEWQQAISAGKGIPEPAAV